jgi:DNA-binding NarL/FixJ family response regulator
MRNVFHQSSRLEASKVLSKTELQSSSPRVVALADETIAQQNGAQQNGAASARSFQGTRQAPISSKPRTAQYPRNPSDIDFKGGPSESQHVDDLRGGEEPGAVKLKPGIVVIHCRAVFRDCFVRCLEISYRDHEIFSFANLAEWYNSKEPNALAAAVIIVVIESGSGKSGIAGLEFLETAAANIPVVIVSDIDDLDHIVHTLKSGVRGYIPTSLPFNVAVEAVRLVKAGGIFFPASSVFQAHEAQPPGAKSGVLLTDRQMKVVEEIRHGKANKQIAYELHMSEHTVKVHLRHIMRKLKARNRTEVAVLSEDLFAGSKDQKAGPDDRADRDPRPN